jgi:hypothetical protein
VATCIQCLQGYHLACLGCECSVCTKGIYEETQEEPTSQDTDASLLEDTSQDDTENERPSSIRGGKRTRRLKRDDALKDQQSTGRKRAARLFPLDREAPCEWRGLKNAGGGTSPISGCINGLQQARHHGPDKSTSNNDTGNVHRVCHRCHNRWHAANNKDYDWNNTVMQSHSPRPMTEQEKWWVEAKDYGLEFKAIKD